MPPVVVAAGIAGAATLGGAALASRASNKATSAQKDSNDAALAFTREQEAYKRAQYEKAMAAYEQQYNAAQARRDALLASYGFSVPSGGSLSLGGARPGPTAPVGAMGAPAAAPPSMVASPYQVQASEAPEAQQGGYSLSEVFRYPGNGGGNRYGLA